MNQRTIFDQTRPSHHNKATAVIPQFRVFVAACYPAPTQCAILHFVIDVGDAMLPKSKGLCFTLRTATKRTPLEANLIKHPNTDPMDPDHTGNATAPPPCYRRS